MTYKRTVPTTYAVFFRRERILKIGVSAGQRWRNWVARGAEVIATIEFSESAEAREFERRTLNYLRPRVLAAFNSAAEARLFTGIGAGGWTEFFAIPESIEPIELLSGVNVTADNNLTVVTRELVTRTYGRTNGLTHDSKTRENPVRSQCAGSCEFEVFA